MPRTAAFIVMILAAIVPSYGQSYADPRALLEAFYTAYAPDKLYPDPMTSLRSERLNRLFEQDAEEAQDQIGRIDFDPFVNGQDYEITKLSVSEPYYAGGKAVVAVTLENMGSPQELGFLLVDEGGWKIDNVWNVGPEYSYDLLDILQGPLP